jgi:ferric iron reductase protein FhuF
MEAPMGTAEPSAIVDELTSTVDYVRISVGDAPGEWLACRDLTSDPDHLGSVVARTKSPLGTDRDDVATSLFVQGYSFRIATVSVGAWVLARALVDVDPVTTAITLGQGRPSAVRLDAGVRVVSPVDVREVHEMLVDGHLAPLVAAAHDSCRVGAAMLWGNVAASCAAAFSAFANALPDRLVAIGERAELFFDSARPELRGAGILVRVGDRFAWERHSCCLWYRTESGYMCEDCSLRPAAEHRARYAAMAEPVVPVSAHPAASEEDTDARP